MRVVVGRAQGRGRGRGRGATASRQIKIQRTARSAIPTRGSENRLIVEVRMSWGERTRRSRAPAKDALEQLLVGGVGI